MEMKVTLLGTGTSCGVPQIGCTCKVCKSKDKHDKRLRCSAIVDTTTTRVMIDCSPDFRQQMIALNDFKPLEAVLITHEHYDHVGGLDDLRPFSEFGSVSVYAEADCEQHLRERIPYCFRRNKYKGVPQILLKTITPHSLLRIGNLNIEPFRVMHGELPIVGFRIGIFAYITDMKTIPQEDVDYLSGVKVLVINGLRHTPHPTHQTIEEACEFAQRIGAKQTYIIHLSHDAGLHKAQQLPEGIQFGYDGQEILIDDDEF